MRLIDHVLVQDRLDYLIAGVVLLTSLKQNLNFVNSAKKKHEILTDPTDLTDSVPDLD